MLGKRLWYKMDPPCCLWLRAVSGGAFHQTTHSWLLMSPSCTYDTFNTIMSFCVWTRERKRWHGDGEPDRLLQLNQWTPCGCDNTLIKELRRDGSTDHHGETRDVLQRGFYTSAQRRGGKWCCLHGLGNEMHDSGAVYHQTIQFV